MAHCIVCKKELSDYEVEECEKAGTLGLYCVHHLAHLAEFHSTVNIARRNTAD